MIRYFPEVTIPIIGLTIRKVITKMKIAIASPNSSFTEVGIKPCTNCQVNLAPIIKRII